jgi:hypothetical protein
MIGFILLLTAWVYGVMYFPRPVLKFTGIFIGLFVLVIVSGGLIQTAQMAH